MWGGCAQSRCMHGACRGGVCAQGMCTCVSACAEGVHVCVCAGELHERVCLCVHRMCTCVCLRAHGMRVPCVCAHRFLWGCAGAACAQSAQGGAHARAGSVRAPSQRCRDSPVSPRHPVSPRDRGASLGPRRMAQGGWSILGPRGSRRAAGTEGPGPGMDGNVGTPPNPQPCPRHPGPSRVTVAGASPFPSARAPTHVAIVM